MGKVAVEVENNKKKTTTQVDNYTNPANEGMNLSGVNNIQNAVGKPKTNTPSPGPTGLNTDASNLAGTNNIKNAVGTPYVPQKKVVSQTNASNKSQEQQKLQADYNKLKNDYSYTNDDVINSVQYRNLNGDTITANDYNAQINQWKNDVNVKGANIRTINENYRSGNYGYDENAYNNYVADYNRAVEDYDNEVAKKDYFDSYNQVEFINFQDQHDNMTDDILDLYAQLDVAREAEDVDKMLALQLEINNLDAQKTQLEKNIQIQKRVQGGMAIEDYEKNGGDLKQLTEELNALDDTYIEKVAKQVVVNIAKDTTNLIDIASVGIDLVNDAQGQVMKSVAENLRKNGQIDNNQYNDLIDASQDLIDYNVKDDGLASDLRAWTERQQELIGIGATQNQMLAVNLTAGALTTASELWALGKLYRPLKSITGGVERYTELTSRGVDPYVAFGNASVMSTMHYFLSGIPLQYEGVTFAVMANSSITQESMKFLAVRAFNSGLLQAGTTGVEYGVDWVNNAVTEYLSGQDTGLEYSAGDLFKNMLTDMGQTFGAVMGRGALQSGFNSLQGKVDNRDYGNYVNEFDLRMSIARKALYVSNDNPNRDAILNRYSQTQTPGPQSPIPETYVITTQQGYNQAKADRDMALQIYDEPRTTQLEKDIISQGLTAINNGIQLYENQSVLANSFMFEKDAPVVYPLQDVRNDMIASLTPNAEELLANNDMAVQAGESINQITEAQLVENNVIAEIEEFTGQNRENRDYLLNLGERVKAISKGNVEVLVDTTLPMDKPGQIERYPDGYSIIKINPYSDRGMRYLVDHELFHAIVNTEAGKRIINFLDLYATPEQKALSRSYATNNYPEEEQNEEYYADLLGSLTEDKDLLQRLKIVDPGAYETLSGAITENASNLYGIESQTDALLDNIVYGLEEVNETTPGTYNAIHKQNVPYHQLSKLTELILNSKREYRAVMEEINKHPEIEPGLYDIDLMNPEDYKYYKYWFTIEEYGSPKIVGRTEVDNERYSKDDRKGNSIPKGKYGISEGHIVDIRDGETTKDVFVLDNSDEGRKLIGDNVSNTSTPNSKIATSDDQGRSLTKAQQEYLKNSIGDRVDPNDPNSPHMVWMHGTENATFTIFDNTKQMVQGPDEDYVNESKAIYLTSSPKTASSYAGTTERVDPNNIRQKPKSLNELKTLLNSKDVYVDKVDGEYVVYGEGLESIAGVGNDMDDFYSFRDSLETYYKNPKTGKVVSIDDAYDNDIDVEDWEEIYGWNTSESTAKGVIDQIWDVAYINQGIYELYAKSENPLIIDGQGKRWDELPSLGTEVVQEGDDPDNFMSEYDSFKTVEGINRYFADNVYAGSNNKLYEIGDKEFEDRINLYYRDEPEILKDLKDTIKRNGYKYVVDNREKPAYATYDRSGEYGDEWSVRLKFFKELADLNYFPKPKKQVTRELTSTRDYEQYALDNGYDSIRYTNIYDPGKYGGAEKSDVLVVFDPSQVKSVNNAKPTGNPDIRYSFDPSKVNSLKGKLDPYISSQSDELADVIDQAEEQIVFTGDLTPAMRKSLSDLVYDATFAEEEGVDEGITAKDINKFLRENPLKWASLKGDNRMSLVEFQKEHPGVKFAKDGGKDWDVIAGEFDSQFPGLLNPEDYNSAVDFLDKIQALREDAMGRNNRVPTMSRSEFDEIFEKTMDDFIKANQPKLSQPKEMSESAMRNVEKQREAFRNSVKTWVRDYDVLRNKFDSFDDKTFDDALADVYITGDINPETKKQLVNDVMKNDFEGYYQGNGAKEYVNRFVNEATDYYVLETDYNLNQKYRDTIAKNANIVAQAQNSIYEEEYDRAETARTLDAMAKEVRLRDYDAVYDYVQRIIEGINDKKNILANRDLKEYNDLVSDGDENVRQLFNELLEQPIRTAQREELAILQDEMDTIAKLQEQVGIKMYSKEDEAIGWLLEGKKQDGSEYYISNLKRDFPEKWQDIVKVADYYRDTVERWYNEEVKTRENVYGDMTYQNDVRTAKLQTDVESAKSILARREADLRNNPNSSTQAGYSKAQKVLATAEKRLNAQLQRNLEHDSTRRQYTPYRQDYFHHTNEVHFVKNIKALAEMIKNGTQSRKNRIPSELAGRTENTKPKTTIQSYMWRQGEKNYSSSGFASLRHRLVEHANAMAFDPAVSYMRNVEFIFRDLDAENKASNYIAWFTKYINNLAGKTHDLDRLLREMTPDETMRVLNILNTRAKKNAVYGNLSSALVQAGNFPVGLALAVKNGGKQTAQDLTRGMVNYLRDIKNGVRAQDSSTLLALRYFNANLKDARLSANLDNLGSWMMEALDKTTAETLWYTFKAQGERLGMADPLAYADEMVDRSIQSRRPEDMPLSQQSEIVKLVAPFQVEVNNQWQVMKDLFKGATKGDNKTRNFAGIVALMISSALMNIGFEKLIHRKPLFDPLSAIYEAISDPEATDAQITGRVLGELIGAIPGGQYVPSLLGLDSTEAKKFFGESDPSRYGIGNMGLSAIMDLFTSAGDDNATRKALENIFFTYVMPGWGKQTQRVLKGSQDFGYLPKYVNGKWRRDPIHYTSTGGVGFVNDPKDVFDYMKSLVGGQYATKAGRKYIESDFKKLGVGSLKDANGKTISNSQALQVRKELQDLGVFDDVVEQIQSGKMTPAKAGLSDKVINMNDEEFDSAYNSMLARAEGISNQLREMYNWDDTKEQEYQKAIDIEADYKDGKKVTDSEALKTRKALEEAGIYQDVIDYIAQNGLDYTDVGLGKRVVGYDQDKFAEIYAKKIGGGN